MKDIVITCAGGSTRFSNSVNAQAHKSIYKADGQVRCLLEWQIDTALSSENVNKIIVVVGFLHTQVEEFIKSKYPNNDRIVIVDNKQWSSTGSNLSMCLGLLACKDTKAHSILCVEGDLYASNFKELIEAKSTGSFCATTNGHSTIDSNVDVLGIVSKTSVGFQTSFEYSRNHSAFDYIYFYDVVTLFPSGQMWEIATPNIDFDKVAKSAELFPNETNLEILQHFSFRRSPMAPFELKDWINCNTITELLKCKALWK